MNNIHKKVKLTMKKQTKKEKKETRKKADFPTIVEIQEEK